MGKHGSGTSDDSGWDGLTPQEKADEFDASAADPVRYAQDNFGAGDDDAVNDARRGQGFPTK